MKTKKQKESIYTKRLLVFFLNHKHNESVIADYEEEYHQILESNGLLKAKFWIILQIFILIPSFLKKSFYWGYTMFGNYLLTGFRNIKKQKSFSFINIVGLVIGIGCCLLILLWVLDEISYDNFHNRKKDIFKILSYWDKHDWNGLDITPVTIGPAGKEKLPEIRDFVRIYGFPRKVIKYKDNVFFENGGIYADQSLFKVFDFPFVKGDLKSSLKLINNIVITENLASKYFGEEEPVGKFLEIESKLYTVTGVIKNIPYNSHLKFEFVVSIENIVNQGYSWQSFMFTNFVLLDKLRNPEATAESLTNIAINNGCPHVIDGLKFRLQPLKKIHLFPKNVHSWTDVGDYKYIYVFIGIAFLILLIACANFINLSTARASIRSKEIGMRKVIGAGRIQLMKQFFIESFLFVLIAVFSALLAAVLALPAFNNLTGKHITVDIFNVNFVLGLCAVVFITTFLSGSYPAVYLSSFKPVKVLKNLSYSGSRSAVFRKVFVFAQFSATILLIIVTLFIYKQLNFIQNTDLGFETENVITIPNSESIGKQYKAFKNELLKIPGIAAVSAMYYSFTKTQRWTSAYAWENMETDLKKGVVWNLVDFDFFELCDLEIMEGRSFSKDLKTDAKQAFIINETAAKQMGLESPVGIRFAWGALGNSDVRRGEIIGVVKNAHFKSLHNEIYPHLFLVLDDFSKCISSGVVNVKIISKESGDSRDIVSGTLNAIEKIWKKFDPVTPFEYRLMKGEYEDMYRSDKKTGSILLYFTLLAVFISCLGLFGLTSFFIEIRIKEIGIRKILGAKIPDILKLVSREFIVLIFLSNILAWPVAFYFTKKWLQNFAYSIDINIWTFLLSGIITVFIALVTISYKTVRNAAVNPINSLRNE